MQRAPGATGSQPTMPRMPRIRCVTLDWGDTLATNWGMPYLATQRRAFTRLAAELAAAGGTVPAGFVQACIDELQAAWTASVDPVRNPDNAEFDQAAMMRRWVASTAAEAQAAATALRRASDMIMDTVIPFAETLPALTALKQAGLRVGILSHVPFPADACRRWYARHGLAGHIDFYSLSCEIGFIKPHPAHYQDALRQAGCAAGEILHVGDHPRRDVAGGKAFGFRTCLRLTENIYKAEDLATCGPDAEILHLDELPDVVRRLS
jgi:FMN phosphatase YigB (HAD superfamily)